MGALKLCAVLVLLLVGFLSTHETRAVEGRPLSFPSPFSSSSSSSSSAGAAAQPRYWKLFSTLGIVCECCDGVGGECSSAWNKSCSSLRCSPWKSH